MVKCMYVVGMVHGIEWRKDDDCRDGGMVNLMWCGGGGPSLGATFD